MMLKRKTLKRKIPNNKTLYNAWEITDKLSPIAMEKQG